MTDALLERISRLEHIDGARSRRLAGAHRRRPAPPRAAAAAAAPEPVGLRRSPIAVSRCCASLPALESIVLTWTQITDAGAAHLARCEQLQSVDLSGTPTGDGAIRALAGKPQLHDFRSGNGVTDAGLALLHDLPVVQDLAGRRAEHGAARAADARPELS